MRVVQSPEADAKTSACLGFHAADPHARWPIDGPQFHGVIPRRAQERVLPDGVEVDAVALARVLVERTDRVGGRRQGRVVDLERAVGDGGDDERIVGFRPAEVVDAVGGVEGRALGDGRPELENVEAAVAEYAEVLGGGDGELVLVEWAELDGVAVEGGFEDRHGAADRSYLVVDWVISGVSALGC
ncbi:NAD-dependent glycerol-3-phosphate dehydrogenase family protein [Striga asiatica]|uniref:NAD-dependent glycerol-3-phosphate dehydrogenase family protein n=1 Tax=Striga asiatica TaxID=4170 RepID=A0A5A7NUX1_STRAF|nr:NAD-dependent glycerol-3-phosphate dehydrogenase family protein [Striga asiatica]